MRHDFEIYRLFELAGVDLQDLGLLTVTTLLHVAANVVVFILLVFWRDRLRSLFARGREVLAEIDLLEEARRFAFENKNKVKMRK